METFTSLHAFHIFTDNKMEPLVNYGVKWFVFLHLKSVFSPFLFYAPGQLLQNSQEFLEP